MLFVGIDSMTGYVTQLQFQKSSGFAWKTTFDSPAAAVWQILTASSFENRFWSPKNKCLELVLSGTVKLSRIFAMMREEFFSTEILGF
jgi:uncharacterized protein YndB with AHSA1/START domain